jgi:ribonuclease HII
MLIVEKSRKVIIGVDEAGRGPLAGPVVSGAVIIKEKISGVKDSKSLSQKQREALFDIIREKSVAFGVGIASSKEIDEINILNAALLSMKRAIDALFTNLENKRIAVNPKDVLVLVDGNRKIKGLALAQKTIVKGDSKIYEISAASILAKVVRDRMMCVFDKRYPQYGFCKHKGYPTKEHKMLIQKYGPCPLHRKSFRGVSEQTFGW